MLPLELLAPAKDKTVGIAAIDCGADAVYIAGPAWGNRKAAGNSLEDIRELCEYAHRFGVRIYLTVNTLIYDDEWDAVHSMMLGAQEAGVDAFIFREEKLLGYDDIVVPMHASTQCSIRTVERARELEALGCSRLILERGISLDEVRAICAAVSCEVEFFVHGALCVCYSGECRLSEYLDGRSADRGECIQACRSLYDLVDADGKVLVRDKALLSLRDFKLLGRLEELAEAGVCSFKIEGRLKNETYVRNVVREYSLALDSLIERHPDKYCRASFGRVSGGFVPDSDKTFNRGYTEWWLDGRRGSWSSMDAPKSMGEFVGTVESVKPAGEGLRVVLKPAVRGLALANGDGFAFVDGSAVRGFRADRCESLAVFCKKTPGLRPGVRVFRNLNAAFEREVEARSPRREVAVALDVSVRGDFVIDIEAVTEDGRKVRSTFNADVEKAENRERAEAMLREQLGKRAGVYSFSVRSIDAPGPLPLLSASTINMMRRCVAGDIPERLLAPANIPSKSVAIAPPPTSGPLPLQAAGGNAFRRDICSRTQPLQQELNNNTHVQNEPLMRTRYCIRYELGMCPKYQGAKASGPLYLVNNGRRLALGFDCAKCEMTVDKA
jgi:putative protease